MKCLNFWHEEILLYYYRWFMIPVFVAAITMYLLLWHHQAIVDPGNLHWISNWILYLTYTGSLLSFHCSCVGEITRLILLLLCYCSPCFHCAPSTQGPIGLAITMSLNQCFNPQDYFPVKLHGAMKATGNNERNVGIKTTVRMIVIFDLI